MPMTNTWRHRLTHTGGTAAPRRHDRRAHVVHHRGDLHHLGLDHQRPHRRVRPGPQRSQPHRPGRLLRPGLRHPVADRDAGPPADAARLLVTARPDAPAHHPRRRHRLTGGLRGHPGRRHRHHPALERRGVGVRTPLRKRRPAHQLLPAPRRVQRLRGARQRAARPRQRPRPRRRRPAGLPGHPGRQLARRSPPSPDSSPATSPPPAAWNATSPPTPVCCPPPTTAPPHVAKLLASHAVPDHGVPADGTTVHVLATVSAVTPPVRAPPRGLPHHR